jgi:hypothetical protein
LAEAELRAGNFEQAEALVMTEEIGKPRWGAEFLRRPANCIETVPVGGDRAAADHDWFTEGFDTVDLKEAKALLN